MEVACHCQLKLNFVDWDFHFVETSDFFEIPPPTGRRSRPTGGMAENLPANSLAAGLPTKALSARQTFPTAQPRRSKGLRSADLSARVVKTTEKLRGVRSSSVSPAPSDSSDASNASSAPPAPSSAPPTARVSKPRAVAAARALPPSRIPSAPVRQLPRYAQLQRERLLAREQQSVEAKGVAADVDVRATSLAAGADHAAGAEAALFVVKRGVAWRGEYARLLQVSSEWVRTLDPSSPGQPVTNCWPLGHVTRAVVSCRPQTAAAAPFADSAALCFEGLDLYVQSSCLSSWLPAKLHFVAATQAGTGAEGDSGAAGARMRELEKVVRALGRGGAQIEWLQIGGAGRTGS